MQIQILSVDIKTKPNSRGGTYQDAEVAYKNNTVQGKVEGKSVRSFGAQEAAFKALAVAQPGETYEVQVVKNDKGFNDWVSVQKAGAVAAGGVAASVPTGVPARAAATSTPVRSTYETPEERAKKQVYIIRQSSVSSAIALHSVGAKALKLEDVLNTAKALEGYVLGTGATGFDDLPDVPDEFVDAEGNPRIT